VLKVSPITSITRHFNSNQPIC